MRISYRMANEGDIDAMAEFWSENSGWDVIDSIEWKRRFTYTPFGHAAVALATDEETKNIIGQFIFIPVCINVNGKEVNAYRPYAPVLKESLQTKFGIASLFTGQHPLLKMYQIVAADLKKQGVSFIYIIPDPRWVRVLQAFPFIMTHKFPLWSLSLPLNKTFKLPKEITIEKINPFDEEIDRLWQQASTIYSSTIVRNSKTLPWKTSHGDFKVFTIRCNQQMIGLFTIVYKIKDYQWLICDMLTKDKEESLTITIQAACNRIHVENKTVISSDDHPRKIAILATTAIEEVVKKIGFEKDPYHFTLAVHLLNKNEVDKKDISPANWYVSAND